MLATCELWAVNRLRPPIVAIVRRWYTRYVLSKVSLIVTDMGSDSVVHSVRQTPVEDFTIDGLPFHPDFILPWFFGDKPKKLGVFRVSQVTREVQRISVY